jgi:TrmH family RNA methyltransferase
MSRVSVVLHRPIYPRNIGMCARAMANMGVSRLILIAPQGDYTHEEAKQGAAHAQEILRNAIVYPSSEAFLAAEGDGVRVALSGRDGRLKSPEFLDVILDRMGEESDHPIHGVDTPIHLFFGPEDDGLSNDDMSLCHHVCRLPTYGEITSLNLSHAVNLTLYMVQTSLRGVRLTPTNRTGDASAPGVTLASTAPGEPKKRGAYYPTQTIKRWLEALGFDLSARRVNIEKTLNRILLSRCPTDDELRVIDTVLQQTVRKLNKNDGAD